MLSGTRQYSHRRRARKRTSARRAAPTSDIRFDCSSKLQLGRCLGHSHEVLQELIALPVSFFTVVQSTGSALLEQILNLGLQATGRPQAQDLTRGWQAGEELQNFCGTPKTGLCLRGQFAQSQLKDQLGRA